jgi:hypothetical protein
MLCVWFLGIIYFIPGNVYPDSFPLAPHLLDPEAYSETYHTVLELEEGIHIQIQFAITNIGIGDRNSMCRVLFVDEKDAWNAERLFDQTGWTFKPPGHLEIGSCYITAEEDATTIFAEVENGRVAVKLSEPISPTKPPGHLILAGKDFFDFQILMPWAQAEVRYDSKEFSTRSVKGYGCMYHYWVTAWPGDLARQWVRVFGMSADGAFIVISHYPPGKNEPATGSIWLPGEPGPVAFDSLQMENTTKGNQSLAISSNNVTHRLVLHKQLYRHAPLEQVGFLGRIIRLFTGNWVTRTYRAMLEVPGRDGSVPAIVEITADE